MKFHDELNQKLFNDTELKREVYDKLLEISEAFVEYLDINDEAIKDIVITGSSASYNYTEYSDLDLHLIVDYEKVHEECPIVEGYLWSMKSAFNKDHDIFIYGVPVEVYAEDSNQSAISNGIYSLLKDEWIKFPEKIEPTDNDSAVLAKYKELKEASERIEDSEVAEELLDKIYAMRKAGLEEVGEFSTENLVFKMLRNDDVIERLKQMKKEKIDKQLSLESLQERDKSDYLTKDNNESELRKFSKLHADLIEPMPEPYDGDKDLEAVLYYLGSLDGLVARVKTPVETVIFNNKNLKHLLDDNEPQRLKDLSKIKPTLKNPNLIIETIENGTRKNNYIKAFGNINLMKAQLVVVKVAEDGTFYVTTFRLKNRKFLDKLKDGQIIYDLSDTYANKNESLSYNYSITENIENFKSDIILGDSIYIKIKETINEFSKQGYICIHIKKNKNNYGFVQVRNNELYYDYNSNDCTQFKSLEEAKPIINRLVKAGFTVTLLGTGNFSYLNDHRKYTFESYNKKDIKMENKQNAKSLLKKMNEMQLGEHEYIAPFFHGFYESMYTNDGNIEWDLFNDPNSVPEEILNKCIQEAYIPDEYYKDVCSAYLDVLDSYLKGTIKSWGTSELVEIDSPKEYNFRTDDIVAKINITDEINNEINEYIQNNKEAFKKWIKDHHSSYDGFISFYSNDTEEWLELEDLDHNELGSILGFILENQEGDEIEWRLNEATWEFTGGTHWTVDLEDVVQDFNFNVEPESLEDLENYVYDEENDIYVWNKENPDQLKLKYESRKIKSLLDKITETFDYKEMNKKVDEYRKQNNLSPTFEIDTFDKDSEEWKKLREVGIKVSENSPIKLRVENTYFDYGQKWMWTTLIAIEEKADNTSTWQAINPSQQAAILAGYGDEVAQDLIDKYSKEYNKNESTNVKSLLNKINELKDETVNTVAMKRFTNDSKAFDKLNKEIADDKNPKAGKLYPSEKEYAKAHKKLMNNSRLLRNRNIKKYGESLVEKCNKQLKRVNEGAGAAVTIYFDYDPHNDYRIDADIDTVTGGNKITCKNILIADYYHGAHAYDGGYILFEEDAMKEAFVNDYNNNERMVDDPEITIEDIEHIYLGGYENIYPIVFGWGWIPLKCEYGTVLDWSKTYLPTIEIIATIEGEEHRTTCECNGKYYPSDEACEIISDPEMAERDEYGDYDEEDFDESLKRNEVM